MDTPRIAVLRGVYKCILAAGVAGVVGVTELAGPAAAQPPELLGDVRPGVQSASMNMQLGPAFGQDGAEVAYFRMELIPNDVDIWRTDGTPEGTYPVLDYISTTQTSPGVIGMVNGRVLMAQNNVLFSCDALGGDARHLRSQVGVLGSNQQVIQFHYPSGLLPGGRVFPVQLGSQLAQDLMISDGASTTVLLANTTFPDLQTFSTPHFVPFADGLLFPVNQSSNFPRPALWRTDGTPAGTVMIREFPRTNSSLRGIEWLTQGPGGFYFSAPALSDPTRSALWRTDGTAEGCVELITNQPLLSGFLRHLTPVGSRLFFTTGQSGPNGGRLCVTDGTPAGTGFAGFTTPLMGLGSDGNLNPITAQPPIMALRGEIAVIGAGPLGLWIGDGSTAGMRRVTTNTVLPISLIGLVGPAGSERLLFTATHNDIVRVWSTDGTTEGTVELTSVVRTFVDSPGSPRMLARVGARTVFAVQQALSPRRWIVYATDGTDAGTRLLIDPLQRGLDSNPGAFVAHDGTAWFTAQVDASSARRRFGSGGTPDSTEPCAGLGGPATSEVVSSLSHNGVLLTITRETNASGNSNQKLYASTDPCAPSLVRDLGSSVTTTPNLTTVGNLALFRATSLGDPGVVLWRTDGTPDGTVPLQQSNPDPPFSPSELVPLNGRMFFCSFPRGNLRVSLWLTDGTDEGTENILTIDSLSSYITGSLRSTGSRVFFIARNTTTTSHELWTSDGTAPGTHRLDDTFLLPGDSSPQSRLAVIGNRVLAAKRAESGSTFADEVWISDEDATTMSLLREITPAPVNSSAANLTRLVNEHGELVVFTASDAVAGVEPWVTDGTTEGTRRLADIWPGVLGFISGSFTVVDGRAYIAAHDGTRGLELWRTDGTPDGTELAGDIHTGTFSSTPTVMGAAAGHLFVSAIRQDVGREPFTMRLVPCLADFNHDNRVDPDDLAEFITCFFLDVQFPGICPESDFNGDSARDPDDLADFVTTFFLAAHTGC